MGASSQRYSKNLSQNGPENVVLEAVEVGRGTVVEQF
jgi:hypothetical protein